MRKTVIYFFLLSSCFLSVNAKHGLTYASEDIHAPHESRYDTIQTKKDEMKTIAFYLQDGVEILDFGGPMEVFVYAGYKVFTVSKNKKPIQSQGVLTIIPDYSIDDAPKADILAFFGGHSVNAYKNTKVIDWVKEQKEVSYHFSVCTGAFVLAEAGILKGKTATTFHDVLDKLESDYPEIEVRREARFVDNGNVITTAGVSAGIDGALHLVAKLQGLNAAKRAAYYMEYDNWQPGNGLILSNDNPYLDPPKLEELASFTGTYQFKDDLEVVVTVDEENDQLSARVANNVYPMYYESRDLFSDVGNEPIFFQRNEKDEIIGYKLSLDGKIYQKLN
ncbi:MAG: DJ-1/PfpI family protein [Bacteroidota bacterium]